MNDPQPVEIVAPHPVPVAITSDTDQAPAAARAVAKVDADILRTEGQRSINRIWERTQAIVALSVVETSLGVIGYVIVRNEKEQVQLALSILFGLANLVLGFYFGRTNHQRTGGVGVDEQGR